MNFPRRLFRFFSSYGLAVTVFLFLMLIVILGTLDQVKNGLFLAQRTYFDSFFVYYQFGATRIPVLPGGYLLMIVLFINMLCGAIIRARKTKRAVGLLMSHSAIMFMLVAGFVSFYWKTDGSLQLGEGKTGNQFTSFQERVIEIEALPKAGASVDDKREVWTLRGQNFEFADGANTAVFTSPELPFTFTVERFYRNSLPQAEPKASDPQAVEGARLQELPLYNEEAEKKSNLAGAIVRIEGRDVEPKRGLLWELETAPWTFEHGGTTYAVGLSRRRFDLPFNIKLLEATTLYHPGTAKARAYSSRVLVNYQGQETIHKIEMNEPLRLEGFAVFQSTMDARQMPDGTIARTSGFQIVRNPSDHWPLYALIFAGLGLFIHFMQSLVGWLGKERRRRESAALPEALDQPLAVK